MQLGKTIEVIHRQRHPHAIVSHGRAVVAPFLVVGSCETARLPGVVG